MLILISFLSTRYINSIVYKLGRNLEKMLDDTISIKKLR